jgi:hypothetical protein
MDKPFLESKKRLVKKRLQAKVFPIRLSEQYMLKKFYRSQKTMGRKGNRWFKRLQAKKRRSLEREMIYYVLYDSPDSVERYAPDFKRSIYWYIW